MFCSPRLLFFIPSGLFVLFAIIITFTKLDFFLETNELIFLNFLLLFLSIQFFMLGIYSTLRAKQIQIYKGNLLNKFFKLFKLRLALIIGLIMMTIPFIYYFFDLSLFEDNFKFIFLTLIAILGINIIANSFFVSLLEIDENN